MPEKGCRCGKPRRPLAPGRMQQPQIKKAFTLRIGASLLP
jgi:hypothetical protein